MNDGLHDDGLERAAHTDRLGELRALNLFGQRIHESLEEEEILRLGIDAVFQTLAPNLAVIYRLEGEDLVVRAHRAREIIMEDLEKFAHKKGDCLCGIAAERGESVFSLNIFDDPRCTLPECKSAGLQSFASVPLRFRNELIGVLAVGSTRERDLTLHVEFLQSLASMLSIGLHRAHMHRELTRRADDLQQAVRARTSELEAAHHRLRQDLEERKRLELERERSGSLLSAILDSLPQNIAVLDSSGVITLVNRSWCEFAETNGPVDPAKTGAGTNYLEIARSATGPDASVAHDTARGIAQVLSGSIPSFSMEYPCHSPDTKRWFLFQAVPLKAANKIKGVVVSHLDITKRKFTEEALRASEERFIQITRQSREMVWEVDSEGLYTYVGDASESVLGYLPDELIGKVHFYDLHPEEGREAFKKCAFEIFARKEGFKEFLNPALTKDGQWVWLSTSGIPILDRSGNLSGYRGSDSDITERKHNEEALRISEENYRTIFNSVGDAIAILDIETGDFLDLNERVTDLLGYSVAEAKELGNRLSLGSVEQADLLRDRAVWEGPQSFEWPLANKEGQTVWVEVHLEKVRLQGVDRLLAVARDIDERKRAERIVKKNEARLQALMNLNLMQQTSERDFAEYALEEIVRISDSRVAYFHFVHAEQETVSLFAWSRAAREGCILPKTPHYSLSIAGIWADCVRTGQPTVHNDYANHPDRKGLPPGHTPLTRHMSVPIFDEGGVVAVVGVGDKKEPYDAVDAQQLSEFAVKMWDTLKQKKAQQALRESEETLRTVTSSTHDAIFIVDEQGRITFWNYAAEKLFGYGASEILGQELFLVFPSLVNVRDAASDEVFSAHYAGKATELPARHKNGRELSVELSLAQALLKDARCGIGIARDISQRKEMERLREDVDRVMRHDLKSPLNCVIGFPQILMMDDNLTPRQEEMLKLIEEAGYQLLNQINMSLDLYKMETGQYQYQPKRVDIVKLLNRLIREFTPKCGYRMVSLKGNINGTPIEHHDRLFIQSEELLCYTMLSNLIDNAIEASPSGESVSIDVAERNRGVSISIHNHGQVPEPVRDKFFEKYTTHGKVKGTGLGTYSAKLIAEVQGGTIGFETSRDRGTTVSVLLPRDQ